MAEEKKDNYLLAGVLLVAVVVVGIFGLTLLQKYSVNNKYICGYLGGMWLPDKNPPNLHRCYTYEEFYK